MRVVEREADLSEALSSARREATNSFGNDTLFVERFVTKPRHIELQILADSFGTTVHLGERECSLQRRHQKIIEESPSPFVSEIARDRLGDLAIAAAKSVGYRGVGTVEFIVSAARPDEYFFMEMNTRLQVEHPVTEMVTGLDLVEQQLRVAAGEALSSAAKEVRFYGHSVEVRLYSEDPTRNFLPTDGEILLLREPEAFGVRVDSGLTEGMKVGTYYDPMLSKVITWGEDRNSALARMRRALSELVVLGVTTNIGFLEELINLPRVVAGDLDTALIEDNYDVLTKSSIPDVAYTAYASGMLKELELRRNRNDPWDQYCGWRIDGAPARLHFTFKVADNVKEMTLISTPSGWRLNVNDASDLVVNFENTDSGFTIDGQDSWRYWSARVGSVVWISFGGQAWTFRELETAAVRDLAGTTDQLLRSPMPGKVIRVFVSDGQVVEVGETLVMVEAMKMEHSLIATRDGPIEVLVEEGEQVVVDQVLVRWTPEVSE